MIRYHFTCNRAAKLIKADGVLRPQPCHLLDGLPVVWLTDLHDRSSELMAALGMTWHSGRYACRDEVQPCYPVAARFAVRQEPDDPVLSFHQLAAQFPVAARLLRGLPGSRTDRWLVSTAPIPLHIATEIRRSHRARI